VNESRVDVLHLCWYVDLRKEPDDTAARWLAAARAHLPAALPRRFGPTEPPRGRLDRDGDAGFRHAHSTAETLLVHAGTPPTYGGTLGTARQRSRIGPLTSHTLDVRLDAADDPAVRAFFLAVADGGATLYASASIRRQQIWTGRTLVSHGPPGEPYLAPLGEWLGLPQRAPHWAWLGSAYARSVGRLLPRPVLTATGELRVQPPGWVPAEWVARLDEIDPARRAAVRMPRGLRTPRWRLLLRR